MGYLSRVFRPAAAKWFAVLMGIFGVVGVWLLMKQLQFQLIGYLLFVIVLGFGALLFHFGSKSDAVLMARIADLERTDLEINVAEDSGRYANVKVRPIGGNLSQLTTIVRDPSGQSHPVAPRVPGRVTMLHDYEWSMLETFLEYNPNQAVLTVKTWREKPGFSNVLIESEPVQFGHFEVWATGTMEGRPVKSTATRFDLEKNPDDQGRMKLTIRP